MKKINKKTVRKIIRLKRKGLHIHEISSKLGISDRMVNKYSKNFPHPKRKIIKEIPAKAKKLSKEKSEILGYLCSEGCQHNNPYINNSYDQRRGKTYILIRRTSRILFSNTDKIIQDRFIYLMKKIYDYKLNPDKRGNFYIARKKVVEDLHKYSNFGSHSWSVPKKLFNEKFRKQSIYFIRAFCDGDATIEKKQGEVRIDSTNHRSLKDLSKLIKVVGIPNKCYQFNSRSRIIIKDIEKYLKTVSFIHPNKLKNLKKLSAERRNFVAFD